ncbi:MAG: STAS/SEC14 domain-containing protein [Anaerolineae bacterium]|nr:STAS/SEC14 domain-containing protein [Anaerolineae bacterium]
MVTGSPRSVTSCLYRRLDSGIHELTFTNVSPDTVTELFAHLNAIFDGKTHRDPRLLILLDGSAAGFPPLNRVMNGGKDLVARHPDRPLVRYALIMQGNMRYIVSALERVIQLFRSSNEVRSFQSSERAAAEAWLLRDVQSGG